MSEFLPEPLTPPDCDLRDFSFMPLDVARLRDSDLAATPDAEVFRTAMLSWCAAWHQVPAASIPDDDAVVARLVGLGRDVNGWRKLRAAGALRGFVKCSDGRLYHPVVAEKANESFAKKQSYRSFQDTQSVKGKLGAAKRWGKKTDGSGDSHGDCSGPSHGHSQSQENQWPENGLKVRDRDSEGIGTGSSAAPPVRLYRIADVAVG